MIYAIYEDDGPRGFCGQSMSITCKWRKLYRLKDYDTFRVFRDFVDGVTARTNPRITAIFDTDAALTGADEEVFDWGPKA